MCQSTTPHNSSACRRLTKRCKVRVHRLTRRRSEEAAETVGIEIAMKNLKLYLENRIIIQENEKLREKALLLHQENQTLIVELHKKFSHTHDFASKSHHSRYDQLSC